MFPVRHVPGCDGVVVLCATLQGDTPPLTGGQSSAALCTLSVPSSHQPSSILRSTLHPFTIYHIPYTIYHISYTIYHKPYTSAVYTETHHTILPPTILTPEVNAVNTTSIHHILADCLSVTAKYFADVNILYSCVFEDICVKLHCIKY